LYVPLKKVITRINLIAPTVEPLDPPIIINVISTISTNGDQFPITVELCTLAPVVVIADTTLNNISPEDIYEIENEQEPKEEQQQNNQQEENVPKISSSLQGEIDLVNQEEEGNKSTGRKR